MEIEFLLLLSKFKNLAKNAGKKNFPEKYTKNNFVYTFSYPDFVYRFIIFCYPSSLHVDVLYSELLLLVF